jgi:predicted DCC family thiol-disulfide oxidoreductase YuxK
MQLKAVLVELVRGTVDAYPVALCRIGVGLAAILQGPSTFWYLQQHLLPDVVRAKRFAFLPDLSPPWTSIFFLVWLLVSSLFTVGFFTTVNGIVLATLLAVLLVLDQNLYSNHVYLLFLTVSLLTISGAGRAISIDARQRPRAAIVPAAPIFLLKFQLSVVYAFTALQKINGAYLAGKMLRGIFVFGPLIPDARLYQAIGIVTINSELFLAFAIWHKKTLPIAFLLGFALHVLIPPLILSHFYTLIVFSLLTLSLYVLFLPERPQSLPVLWDDHCFFCSGWIRFFRTFDWLGRLEFARASDYMLLSRHSISREGAGREIKVVVDGRVIGGYDAVVKISCFLPITMFCSILLGLGPIRAIGRRAYEWIAAYRKCTYKA